MTTFRVRHADGRIGDVVGTAVVLEGRASADRLQVSLLVEGEAEPIDVLNGRAIPIADVENMTKEWLAKNGWQLVDP